MTKKQYNKRVRHTMARLYKWSKDKGYPLNSNFRDIRRPNFGCIVTAGKYKGQKLVSYEQAWDMLKDILGDTDCMYNMKR